MLLKLKEYHSMVKSKPTFDFIDGNLLDSIIKHLSQLSPTDAMNFISSTSHAIADQLMNGVGMRMNEGRLILGPVNRQNT